MQRAAHASAVNPYHVIETYFCILLKDGDVFQGLAWWFFHERIDVLKS